MRLSTLLVASSMALALVVAGACKSEAAAGASSAESAGAPMSEAQKKKTYDLRIEVPSVTRGKSADASVAVTPAKGYKWNKDYPAKLTFKEAPQRVSLNKSEFRQSAGDFAAKDKATAVRVGLKGQEAGEEDVIGEIRFSVCNDVSCVIEKTQVTLAVSVSP